jgi:hypothetical protein
MPGISCRKSCWKSDMTELCVKLRIVSLRKALYKNPGINRELVGRKSAAPSAAMVACVNLTESGYQSMKRIEKVGLITRLWIRELAGHGGRRCAFPPYMPRAEFIAKLQTTDSSYPLSSVGMYTNLPGRYKCIHNTKRATRINRQFSLTRTTQAFPRRTAETKQL